MNSGFRRGKIGSYKKTAVETATKEELILMLYQGAIRFTHAAIQFIQEKNFVDASKNICRAQAIIVELMNSLNFEAGGEIAKNLEYLYSVMVDNLTTANFQKTVEPLNKNLYILDQLRIAWEGVLEQIKSGKVSPQGTSPAS